MKKLFLLFVSLCIMKALAAQLSGTIVNAQHEPVFFANVSIVRQGQRIVAFQAQAWQEDAAKPIATAFGHFKLRHAAGSS